MSLHWPNETPFAITVSDAEGKILYMNDRSAVTFEKYGGKQLVGKSLFDCHPQAASDKLRDMLEGKYVHAYTIEKEGVKKLIYQSPWYEDGKFAGYVEFSLILPSEMPHFVRKP